MCARAQVGEQDVALGFKFSAAVVVDVVCTRCEQTFFFRRWWWWWS